MSNDDTDTDDRTLLGDRDQGTDKDLEPDYSRRMAAYWKAQIKASDEQTAQWHKRGTTIIKRFRDERASAEEEGRKANVLWAWYQTMKPAVYGKCPNAIAERRFLDHDPVGKMSAMILERSLRNEFETNGFDASISRAVQDYLLTGRGQCWARYEPKFGKGPSLPNNSFNDMADANGPIEPKDESDKEEKLEETGEQLINESAPVDYIHWKDFRYYPARARTWTEVQAVSKDVHLSKQECIDAFGEDIGEKIQADATTSTEDRNVNINTTLFQDINEKKRTITEIWNKADRKVYWVSEGYEYLCKEEDDPLELEAFFPCPEPLSAVTTNETLIPVPFYMEWQDQAIQIDELTQKINALTKAIRTCGVYKATDRNLQRLLSEGEGLTLVPVSDWSQYGEKGLEGNIYWLPIKETIEALQVTIETRAQILQDLDRVTGISDVLRGTTDARETLGGQRLKANSASTRVEDSRKDVARFTRDVVRLTAEIIAKHFSPETLIQSSGILYEEDVHLDQGQGQPPQAPPLAPPQQPPQLPPPPMGAPPMPPGPPGAMPPPMGGPAPMQNIQMGGPPMPMAGQLSLQGAANPMMGMMSPIIMVLQKVQKAIELLRQDIPRGYRVDIEVDTMVGGDQMQERQDAVQFIEAITQFVEKAGQIVMVQPDFAPLAGAMLQFGVRKFRSGRDLEAKVDEYVDTITKKAAQPKPPQPNPEMIKAQAAQSKAQADIQKTKMQAQADQATAQAEIQRQQIENQGEAQNARQDTMQTQMDLQQQRIQMQIELTRLQIEKIKAEAQLRSAHMDHQSDQLSLQQQAMKPMNGPPTQ